MAQIKARRPSINGMFDVVVMDAGYHEDGVEFAEEVDAVADTENKEMEEDGDEEEEWRRRRKRTGEEKEEDDYPDHEDHDARKRAEWRRYGKRGGGEQRERENCS